MNGVEEKQTVGRRRYLQWRKAVLDVLGEKDRKVLDCIRLGYPDGATARHAGIALHEVEVRRRIMLELLAPFASCVNVNLSSDTGLAVIWAYAHPAVPANYSDWKAGVWAAVNSVEVETLRYLACDFTNKEIAYRQYRSVESIRTYLAKLKERLGLFVGQMGTSYASSRAVLAVVSVYAGISCPPDWSRFDESVVQPEGFTDEPVVPKSASQDPHEIWKGRVLYVLGPIRQEVLGHVMLGRSNVEVAKQMFRTENTIKTFLRLSSQSLAPFAKTVGVEDIGSRTGQAVVFAYASPLAIEDRSAWQGDVNARLSSRRREILRLVAAGLSNGQIAARIALEELTVKSHLAHIAKALQRPGERAGFIHPGDRTALAVMAVHAGFLDEPTWP